jgi:hypothetical protein
MSHQDRTCSNCSQCDPQYGCEYFYELDAEDALTSALIECENFTPLEDDALLSASRDAR